MSELHYGIGKRAAAPRAGHVDQDEAPLTPQERLRRLVLACCSALRNFAYYRAGWDGKHAQFFGELKITINGNFIDTGVLEWCKLFGDNDQKYHWSNVLPDVEQRRRFKLGLLAHLGCDRKVWEAYRKSMIAYRIDFLAHLNDARELKPPKLDFAVASVAYYHAFVLRECNDGRTYGTLPADPMAYYDHCYAEAKPLYGRA